jgi:sterol desaturase/sphingolipid hydroxylase (fatty acid hydroxylase superfamily)
MQMQALLDIILRDWTDLAKYMAAFVLAFGILAKWTPCNRGQALWRKDAVTDILYAFVIPVLSRFVRVLFLGIGVAIVFYNVSNESVQHYLMHGYGPLAELPIWGQAALMFIVSDVLLYWIHRWFHGSRMWKFHAIHHSSATVDWLSTYRFHPVNTWLAFTLVDTLMVLAGFAPAAVASLVVFNIIYSPMVHANLNWTFGPFKYFFASPVFHRWHHTSQAEGMDKNFAPTIPLIDVIFGTFYMPEGKLPEHYGVPGSDIPDDFLGQLAWPFRKKGPQSH